MNNRELVFALKFQTSNANQIKKAADQINKAAAAAKRAEKDAKGAGTAMQRLALRARAAGKAMVRFSREARSAFSRMRTGALRLATALGTIGFAVGFTTAINVAKEFEFQLARLSAITGQIGRENGEQFKALEETARRLGATTQFTAGQVGNGLRLLAQAGFSAQEAISAIPGTLNLAIAATTDLGTATTITANTIRGFALQASEAERVADILTATTQGSNTTIEALGEALKFVAPAAQSANQSIETVSAALGTLSDAGLKGTLAGTGLRRVMVGLLNPTKAARDAFEQLGLDVKDLDPRLRDLQEIFEDLNKAGFGASEAFEAFGLRGGPAALVLSNMLDSFKELNDEVSKSEGLAQAFANRIDDTLRGSILRLKSAFEEFIISQGALAQGFRRLIDFLRLVLEALNGTVNPMEEGAEAAIQFAQVLRELDTILIAVTATLVAGAIAVTVMSGGLNLLGVAAGAAAVGLVTFGAVSLNTNGNVEQLNVSLEKNARLIKRIEEAEREQAEANAKLQLGDPFVTPEDRTRALEANSAVLAQLGLVEAQITENKNNLLAIDRDLAAAEQRVADLTENSSRFGPGPQGLAGAALFDAREEIELLKEKRAEFEAIQPVLIEDARIRREGIELIDEEERAVRKLNQQRLSSANEINSVLNSLSSKRTTAITDLQDEIKVLQAELGGGEGGKLAAEIEKVLQAAGFSGSASDEKGTQAAILLSRLNSDLDKAKQALATAREGTDQLAIDSASELVELLEKNLVQFDKLEGKAAKQKADLLAELEIRRALRKQIDDDTKARAEEEAARKRAEAAAKSFERFRINQIAKIQQEINLTKVATTERAKAEKGIDLVNRAIAAGVEINQEWIDSLFETIDALEATKVQADDFFGGFTQGAKDFIEESATFAENGAELFKNTFKTLEDELVGFVETGKFSFRELGETIRSTLLRQGVRNVLKGTLGAIPGLGGPEGTAQEAVLAQLKLLRGTIMQETPTKTQAQQQIVLLTTISNSIANLRGQAEFNLPATGGPVAGPGAGVTSGGDFFDTALNSTIGGINSVGGVGGILSAFAQTGGIPRFQNGGITDSDARKALGIGRTEIPAILHPNEAVIPLTKDGRVPLDIVDGLPQVRLPGNGRSIGTATDGPATAAQVAGITKLGAGRNKTAGITSMEQQNALAFLGAPRFQTGTAGFGFSFEGLFQGIVDGLAAAGQGLLNFFSSDQNFFGGLFGGEGILSGVSDFFSSGFDKLISGDLFGGGLGSDDTVGAQGLADATRAIEVPTVADLTPTEQISEGFGDVFDNIKTGAQSVGNFLGIGGEQASTTAASAPVTETATAATAPAVATVTAPAELSGIGKITEGARRQLEEIPGFGRLFKKNEEGSTPFGNAAQGLLPIGLALALGKLGGEAGERGKSTFSPTGRVIGFSEAGDEDAELTKEEKELLKQLNQGRKALGGSGGGGLRSGNARLGGIPQFATGGVVSGPTLALVGERTPEAIIPLAGGSIPVRVSGGQQTGKVITNNVNFQIVTPDADSFREAQSQIQASTAASIGRAAQRQD